LPEIVVTFGLTTPAFAGGADQAVADGIRPPTLGGLLRFWWRASQPDLAPAELKEAEAEIFGAAGRYDEDGHPVSGQRLRIVPASALKPVGGACKGASQSFPPELAYLGYGPIGGGGLTTAGLLTTDYRATFRLIPPAGKETELWKALWLLNAFGGIGSRSRRGWGGVKVTPANGWPACLPNLGESSLEDLSSGLKSGLREVLGRDPASLPDGSALRHTAFSKDTSLSIGPSNVLSEVAHSAAAKALMKERQRLGCSRVAPKECQGKHGTDHDAVYGLAEDARDGKIEPPVTPPTRAAYGLPHPYFLSQLDVGKPPKSLDAERKKRWKNRRRSMSFAPKGGPGGDGMGRRASPLIIKVLSIHECYVPLMFWLPAPFLPASKEVIFKTFWGSHSCDPVTDVSSLDALFRALNAGGWTAVML